MSDTDLCPKCGMAYSTHHNSVDRKYLDGIRDDAALCTDPVSNDMVKKYEVWVHV